MVKVRLVMQPEPLYKTLLVTKIIITHDDGRIEEINTFECIGDLSKEGSVVNRRETFQRELKLFLDRELGKRGIKNYELELLDF